MATVLIKIGKDEYKVRSQGIRIRSGVRTKGVDHGFARIVKNGREWSVTAKWHDTGQSFAPRWREVGSFKTLAEAKRQAAGFFIIRA